VVNPITIPAGRMYGDLDGDGYIDDKDAELLAANYMGKTEDSYIDGEIPIEFYLSDIDHNDSVNALDFLNIVSHINSYGATGNDYTGNYIANPNYQTEIAQFYTDINLPSLKVSQDVIITITSSAADASIFVKGEVMEDVLRIWVKRPPISNVECLVIIINDGSGKCSIIGGDSGIYVDYIDKKFSNIIIPKSYTIPAGRMYGDLNGDGFVDDNDLELFKDVYNNTENYTGTEEVFLLSDFNKSGTI
jgi:hypothetical protein